MVFNCNLMSSAFFNKMVPLCGGKNGKIESTPGHEKNTGGRKQFICIEKEIFFDIIMDFFPNSKKLRKNSIFSKDIPMIVKFYKLYG